MKSQQKLQHHPPSRKSPRLSSTSSSSTQNSAHLKPEPTTETRPEDAWDRSLHAVEETPLKICHPSHEEVNSVRRSSRFTTNKYRTAFPNSSCSSGRRKALTALSVSQLRWPPRLSSSSPAPALTLRNGKNVGSGEAGTKKRCRSEDKEVWGRAGKKAKVGSNGWSLRRSLRLNGNSSPQLALPEPGSKSVSKGYLSENCLKTVVMDVGDEKAKVEKIYSKTEKRALRSAFSELPSVRRSNLTEKCLRSRTVKMHVGNENEKVDKSAGDFSTKRKFLSSEGTEMRHVRNSLRRSTRLNQDGVESPKFEMLMLPEKSAFSSKKCLRSRTVKKQLDKERVEAGVSVKGANGSNKKCLVSPKIKSASDELPDVSERRDKEKCDPGMISEKCLRSMKIQCIENVDGIAKKSTASSEGLHASKNECNANHSGKAEKKGKNAVCCFIGEPIPEEVAQKRWQWRYDLKSKKKGQSWKINADEDDKIILNVDCHYAQAKVGNCVLDIGDCVYVKGEGTKKHVGKILEFFKTKEGEDYFRVQWFFRAEDTVLKDAASLHDKRRLFYSTLMNDNLLDCIISKVNVVKIPTALCLKSNPIQSAAFYYDMEYCLEYSTFRTMVTETSTGSKTFLLNSKHPDDEPITLTPLKVLPNFGSSKPELPELALLDLYSGCGGMSTGLCIGAKLSNISLMTKWAVDYNSSACDSLKLNHPETQVRNESADDFLELLRQWEQLCKLYVCDVERTLKCELDDPPEADGCTAQLDTDESSEEYEVASLVDICYGDPSERGKRGLHFKVRWKGYGPDEDTWELIEGLSNCKERIQEFVRKGFTSKIIPLPGDVDVICGGPPCQGISGYNRYRNFDSPLADERNRQIIVYMDIVEFLKPKYVLMENVVDIIRFDKASLGRYALSRLVRMKYQARLGTIASGCYGLPQFRLRVFIWGAHPSEVLPQFPLPTHDVVVKYWPPPEFERNVVAYDEGQPRSLEEALVLRDSISDLPAVTNEEIREEMAYKKPPETKFETYIRLSKDEMMGLVLTSDSHAKSSVLYDHRPLHLSEHDYLRVCQIPHRKGANFRDLPGVIVGEDNVVCRDPTKEPVMLPTGRPLVPDCVLSFEQGKSKKPYARLWWDETVSTVVTFPHVRSQAILHPEQDRLLTIREYARLQGFPDYYRFCGTIKERYRQIGNAVSIPVARALGYALGMAYQKVIGHEPLITLPPKFSCQRPSADEMVVLGT